MEKQQKQAFRHPFVLCTPPMRRYLEQMFACGEYQALVQIAQSELQQNPYNLDMILYQAISVLQLQAHELIPPSTDLVNRALTQLNLLTSIISLVNVPLDTGLEFYKALGHLLLGNIEQADQLIAHYRCRSDVYEDYLWQYDRLREHWSVRIPVFPRRKRTVQKYPS